MKHFIVIVLFLSGVFLYSCGTTEEAQSATTNLKTDETGDIMVKVDITSDKNPGIGILYNNHNTSEVDVEVFIKTGSEYVKKRTIKAPFGQSVLSLDRTVSGESVYRLHFHHLNTEDLTHDIASAEIATYANSALSVKLIRHTSHNGVINPGTMTAVTYPAADNEVKTACENNYMLALGYLRLHRRVSRANSEYYFSKNLTDYYLALNTWYRLPPDLRIGTVIKDYPNPNADSTADKLLGHRPIHFQLQIDPNDYPTAYNTVEDVTADVYLNLEGTQKDVDSNVSGMKIVYCKKPGEVPFYSYYLTVLPKPQNWAFVTEEILTPAP